MDAEGSPLVLVPNHRALSRFRLLVPLLCAARSGHSHSHIAAAIRFRRIPLLGRTLRSLHAFYLRRGTAGRSGADPAGARADRARQDARVSSRATQSHREFLAPKRGLLRCLQATGRTCTLLPVAFSYDQVSKSPPHEPAGTQAAHAF
jgi:glycerol-3-phosphate O-acyltransferase